MGVYTLFLSLTVCFFVLAEVEVLYMGCVQVLFICTLWVCKNVILATVLNALTSAGSAGDIGTMGIAGSLQSVSLQFSSISLALILYHWCVSGVMM